MKVHRLEEWNGSVWSNQRVCNGGSLLYLCLSVASQVELLPYLHGSGTIIATLKHYHNLGKKMKMTQAALLCL